MLSHLKTWVSVSCDGCTACCAGTIPLIPEFGDDVDEHKTVEVQQRVIRHNGLEYDLGPGLAIAEAEGGKCPYRNDGVGCDLHDTDKPWFCRIFDCHEYPECGFPEPREKS